MKPSKKVLINENVFVTAGKSSRLAALSNKVKSQQFNLNSKVKNPQNQFSVSLKPEAEIALQQATKLIEQRIALILENYPIGKRNSLFKLRYSVELDSIKDMKVKEVFDLLGLQKVNIRHFAMIENMDSCGNCLLSKD